MSNSPILNNPILDAEVEVARLTNAGTPFVIEATVPSNAAGIATTGAIVIDAEAIKQLGGNRVKIDEIRTAVQGATAWTTLTKLTLQDDNGTPVPFVELAVAGLGANEIKKNIGDADFTALAAFGACTASTADKNIVLKADAAPGAGSNLKVVIRGRVLRA